MIAVPGNLSVFPPLFYAIVKQHGMFPGLLKSGIGSDDLGGAMPTPVMISPASALPWAKIMGIGLIYKKAQQMIIIIAGYLCREYVRN